MLMTRNPNSQQVFRNLTGAAPTMGPEILDQGLNHDPVPHCHRFQLSEVRFVFRLPVKDRPWRL